MRDIALFAEYGAYKEVAGARAKRRPVAGTPTKRHAPRGIDAMKTWASLTIESLVLFLHSHERAGEGIETPCYSSSFPRKSVLSSRMHIQTFVIPAKERVKKSGGFRHDGWGAEESAWYKAISLDNTSSFPRKRESMAAARSNNRCRFLRRCRIDSRFRGNDEELVGAIDFFTCSFAGMTKYYRGIIVFHGAELFGTPTAVTGAARILHTLFHRNDGKWRDRLVSLRTPRTPLKNRRGPE